MSPSSSIINRSFASLEKMPIGVEELATFLAKKSDFPLVIVS